MLGGMAQLALAAPLADKEVARVFGLLVPDADTATRQRAIREIAQAGDRRFIAPLVDQMRFVGSRDELLLIVETLKVLAGADAPAADWADMVVWLGSRPDLKPPPGYVGWKGELHSGVDPRFREFLREGVASSVRIEEVQWGGVPVDGIPALVNPRMLPAREATWLADRDGVFGVSIGNDHRAYPLRILDWHEMANDVVGGKPVALAYCTLCGSGVLYDATAAGRRFEFGSSGFLFRSNKLMYDRQTRTLWNHMTGEPVIGTLVGSGIRLERLPVVVTSWGEWKREHPDTKVADINTGHNRPYNAGAAYGAYFASPGTMFPVWQKSRALPEKARVFTLVRDGQAKAYALEALDSAGGVFNDTFAGKPLVVHYREAVGRVPLPESWRAALAEVGRRPIALANDLVLADARAAIARKPAILRDLTAAVLLAMPTATRLPLLDDFTADARHAPLRGEDLIDPQLRNEVASRGLIGDTRAYERGGRRFRPGGSRDTLVDERGAVWRVTDEALVGPGGERLPRVSGQLAYWFGWFAFFPKTQLYGGD
ncbi:MAG: DUF3179 domain-containing protein, partial [Burkholderiales bacterium]